MIQLIKGFKDIMPGEVELWQSIETIARRNFEVFGFSEIRPPMMEKTDLFKRSIGEATDIVEKEMYTMEQSKGKMITLRPEATASVVRAYIQHKLYAQDPVRKLYTIGPMFRRERPQKGRFRQFYQINAEVFGVESPYIDAQIILLAMTIFKDLKVKDVSPHINSLGCQTCRPKFKQALVDFLDERLDKLCDDCKRRKDRNPLRVLDCKKTTCIEALVNAPAITDYLCEECTKHFTAVKKALDSQGVDYVIDKRLVRGLDYYARTTFEIQTSSLGAQNSVAGGGRYDGLVKLLGGPEIPGIGFAIGFDRLVEICSMDAKSMEQKPDVFIAPMGEKAAEFAFEWGSGLSLKGIRTEIELSGKSLKSMMKRANRLNSKYVLMVGENELEQGNLVLRNMETKQQADIPVDNVVESIKSLLT